MSIYGNSLLSVKNLQQYEQTGLTTDAAARLLAQYGPNEIKAQKQRRIWSIFLGQFANPLIAILIFACILSAILREWLEAFAIAAILLLNAAIGFFQEFKAETAINALKSLTAPRARVIRDGKQELIHASGVVPGDLLILEAGDLVAADGNLLQASRLQINEAILTGESLPSEKKVSKLESTGSLSERDHQVFMGTIVASGTARVRVQDTGMSTELGKIAHLITTAESSPTPLQSQLAHVGRRLLWICLGVVIAVAVLGVFQGRQWLELLIFAISLAVAAVPEGMPALVTVALALGVQRMAARNALIRKLPSVETLGSVSVICTDKTGTLTTGLMRVRELWGEDHSILLKTAASCCDAELQESGAASVGDPTELAILIAAKERGFNKQEIERENPRVATEPFDSLRRRMSILRKDGQLYVKGAVESLLPLCGLEAGVLSSVTNANQELTASGLRVLAVAIGSGPQEKNLTLVGLIGIADPPRTEVLDAIREARSAGILPVMITGDHPTTAVAIARELGLVIEGENIENRVHARATPEDKLNLVRSWKSKGEIVAMTGDGVNDAPALQEAHIGIAMGKTGTEVTRQAADLILADDNFATIVAAIKEGRAIYQNIRKAIVYLLTGNFSELMVVLGATAVGLPLPFLAVHLLWINLVTDALPALTLIADPVPEDIMKRGPRPASEPILGKTEWTKIAWVGVLEAIIVLAIFQQRIKLGIEEARNVAFTTMVFSQLLRSFSARSRTKIFWTVGAFSNLWLLGVVFLTGTLQLALHYFPFSQRLLGLSPLSLKDLAMVVMLALIPVSVIELNKIFRKRWLHA